jgi:signal transduction histidine kinase
LKTPIATIKGYLEIIESRDLPFKEVLPKLKRQVERLQEIVAELLDVSRIQAGQQEFQFQKIDLAKLVEDASESIGSSGREIQLDLPKEKIEFIGDPKKLEHVLANILTNAVKYSDEGTPIRIKAMIFGDDVQVSVQDYGIGIDKEYQSLIFSQYFRASGGKAKAKGMGLGLFISKEIVEAHSGRIWVESELGKGATFFVSIPLNVQLLKEKAEK